MANEMFIDALQDTEDSEEREMTNSLSCADPAGDS